MISVSREFQEKMMPPLTFGKVSHNIYRSAYPVNKCLDFIDSLHLKSMISLIPAADIRQDLRNYCKEKDIEFVTADVGVNKEPFQSMKMNEVSIVLEHLRDENKLPCLIFCTNGKLRTSCWLF